jgi:hypothetical protein
VGPRSAVFTGRAPPRHETDEEFLLEPPIEPGTPSLENALFVALGAFALPRTD